MTDTTRKETEPTDEEIKDMWFDIRTKEIEAMEHIDEIEDVDLKAAIRLVRHYLKQKD